MWYSSYVPIRVEVKTIRPSGNSAGSISWNGPRVKRSTQEQRKESGLITRSVEIVAARINEILTATNEQSKQGAQITEALQVFRDVTHRSNQRGEEMRAGLDELSERAEALEQAIGRFRL